MASLYTSPLTEEEYLFVERQAEFKSEYQDGQMFARPPVSANQSLLAATVAAFLYGQVPSDCRVFGSDLRIHIPATRTYTYPDVGLVRGEIELSGDEDDNLLNPLLIVEVLSGLTEGYDRGKKFERYRTIKSFCEYLLVHHDRRRVEYYSKQDDGSWLLRYYAGNDSLAIARIGAQISLSDLYASTVGCE